MEEYIVEKKFDPIFVGRKEELKWLDERLFRRNSFSPFVISGMAGVGKTALIKHWLESRRYTHTPFWMSARYDSDFQRTLENFIVSLNEKKHDSSLIVFIDGSDTWSEEQHIEATSKIFNYKAVYSLIFTRREPIKARRFERLHLEPFSEDMALDLFQKLLSGNIEKNGIREAVRASQGYPLAISLLSKLLQGEGVDSIESFLIKPLYDLSSQLIVPQSKLITPVSSIIVSANQNLVNSLKKQPGDLRKLTPRDFEKLLAELLTDMGWEVELTKQTRDGGSDILAYLNTDIGRLLCLVEAKHYREDRKIGVDLVRTLYGTLCDAKANSAMLVTSSSFTSDAREFQKRHEYQLSLRDYADVVNWILGYGNKTKG